MKQKYSEKPKPHTKKYIKLNQIIDRLCLFYIFSAYKTLVSHNNVLFLVGLDVEYH